MDQHTVLIADSSEEFCMELQSSLRWSCQVRCCQSGSKTLQMVADLHPDILVLDLMLPELDGISVLKALSDSGNHPIILATTCLLSDYIMEIAEKLNVDYLMAKPCSVQATAARVQEQLSLLDQKERDPSSLPLRITGLLMMMGFAGKLHGFRYLREAITMVLRNPNQSITKELYPSVGHLYDTAGPHVERSIRGAIQDAWKHRDDRIWQLYFPPDDQGNISKPTNAAFITRIADGLRISLATAGVLHLIPSDDLNDSRLSQCQES